MITKKTAPTKAAITKFEKPNALVFLGRAKESADLALSNIANALSANPTPEIVVEVRATLSGWTERLNNAESITKDILKEYLRVQGTTVSEKGSKELMIGNYRVSARPHRTGYDSKKVEALFRAKELSVDQYMDKEVRYLVNESKMKELASSGGLTEAELAACRYPENLALQPLEKIK